MRVLLVEDDKSLSIAVAYKLKKAGMEVNAVYNGADGLEEAESRAYDVIVLDRMLPGLDGVSILSKLRKLEIGVPVLLLTAMDGIGDRVEGLNAGADDYLVKPFAMDELIARVFALSRRPENWLPSGRARAFDMELDTGAMRLTGPAGQAQLTGREGRLMAVLMNNAARTLPREVLLGRVWADAPVEDGNLDIHIHYLRKKMAAVGSLSRIETARGIGYTLAAAEKEGAGA